MHLFATTTAEQLLEFGTLAPITEVEPSRHDRSIHVVGISGDTTLSLGNAAAMLLKPFSETQLLASLLPATALEADRGRS